MLWKYEGVLSSAKLPPNLRASPHQLEGVESEPRLLCNKIALDLHWCKLSIDDIR